MRRILAVLLVLTVTCACWSGQRARADQPASFTDAQRHEIVEIVRAALKADPTILRDAVEALQADDANVKQAAARAALERIGPSLTNTHGEPVAGNPDGDVTVVEFYDLRCPYCRRMLPVMAELLRKDPRIRLLYKDIPILGPPSVLGARAVLAAQKQGGYQRLHDALMGGPQTITETSLQAAATSVGLDWERLQHDMADPSIQTRIEANLRIAQSLGVDGTPVYVIGTRILPGAVDLAELESAVAAARTR
jgi:protein-disulfide isomerase